MSSHAGSVDVENAAADRYVVVGNPIAHSRSPWIHAEFARATGQVMRYERQLVAREPAAAFGRFVAEFVAAGGRGMNVTLPFKERAFEVAVRHSDRARLAGAVNTLVVREDGLFGDNTDGAGLIADLRGRLGFDLRGRSVLLLGAGGAARGVIMALLQAGAAALTVANRTPARAQELAEQFNSSQASVQQGLAQIRPVALDAASEADVVINTTSSGVLNAPLTLPAGLFRHCAMAYDCVYGAHPTAFLRQAGDGGAGALSDGLGMLVEQAAESFLIWRGVRPLTAPVLTMLQAALAAEAAEAAGDR